MSASPIPEAKPLLRVKARVRTFLRNHAPDIAAMDPFVVPTIGFDLLYAYIIVRLDRRELVWISVTTHPTAEWVVRQITEAFSWDEPRATSSAIAIGSTAPAPSNFGRLQKSDRTQQVPL